MSTRRVFLMQTAVAAAGAAASTRAYQAAADKNSGRMASSGDSEIVRLAIVGTGQISHRYLKQAVQSSRARLVATCARTIDSAKARAVEYGIDAWFDDYKKMYDKVKPDAVVIATPHSLHAEQSIAALERGIHVLCEKPMAITLEDCFAVVAAAKKSGAVFLNLPYDATPPLMAALAQLNEETLGVFTGAESQVLLPGGARDGWAYDRKLAGSGVTLDTLVYPVSRLISMMGPAQRVTGFVNTLIPHRLLGDGINIDLAPPPRNSAKRVESSIDDNASFVIQWPNGQQAMARSLWGTSIVSILPTVIYGRHGTLWLSGTNVVVHSPGRAIPGADPVTWNDQKDCFKIPVSEIRKNEGLVDHFIDCIQGRSQPTCGGEQQLHVHEILFKGIEAAISGRAQELKTTFKPWHPIDRAFYDTRSRFV